MLSGVFFLIFSELCIIRVYLTVTRGDDLLNVHIVLI